MLDRHPWGAPAARHIPVVQPILAIAVLGCAPAIGDDCGTSTDCSVSGDRVCDTASPGGYCTVAGCEQDTCPDGAVCVEFRFDPQRIASSWCMASCGGDGDCRTGEGYECLRASTLLDDQGQPLARVTDSAGDRRRFCSATEP